jgi:septum site-determining protein MinD
MSQTIGVLSGKGGVGKTTVVINLAAALVSEFGKRVILLDSNINSSHLGLHLGIYEDPPVTIREIMKKRLPISSGIYVHSATGIKIIPTPLNGEGMNLKVSSLKKLMKKLSAEHDFVIIDCPPGLGKDATTAVSSIDAALIVTTPDLPSVADALKTINLLNKARKKVLGVVVNKKRSVKYELTVQEIETTCGANVIGVVPDDKHVPESVSEGLPVVMFSPHSNASIAFKKLAANLLGVEYQADNVLLKLANIFSKNKRAPIAQGLNQGAIQPVNHF